MHSHVHSRSQFNTSQTYPLIDNDASFFIIKLFTKTLYKLQTDPFARQTKIWKIPEDESEDENVCCFRLLGRGNSGNRIIISTKNINIYIMFINC